MRVFCDYFQNKAETKKMHGGNLDPLDELLVRLKWDTLYKLYSITEGKYWNQPEKIRKIRVVLSSESHETGGTAKKVTASESVKPGPHTHIIFF